MRDLPEAARLDRAFEAPGDRYSRALRIRPALNEARSAIFSDAAEPLGALRAAHRFGRLIDHLLRQSFRVVSTYVGSSDDPRDLPLCVIATGGYGRRELCPFSDVDLLVVHAEDRPDPQSVRAVEALFPFLWDTGIQLAHAVRSLDEVAAALRGDLVTATAMLEGRFVTGDAGLYRRLQREVAEPYLRTEGRDYVTRRMAEAELRHDFYGGSPAVKEPNVKESVGGLRDVHALLWIDRAVRAVFELDRRSLFPWDAAEGDRFAELLEAYDFLVRVRVHLHQDAGRKNDRLDLATWPRIAERLGYPDQDGLLGVEAFMRDYHQRTRRVVEALERILDEVEAMTARGRASAPAPSRRPVAPGFTRSGDQLYPASEDVFTRDPVRLLEAFLLAQRHSIKPSHRLVLLARRDAPRLARSLRTDPRSGPMFRAVFEGVGNVSATLSWMHRSGVLSALLPEFGDVTGLVRFEPHHQYTVDEHSLRAVGFIDELEREEGDAGKRDQLSRVMRKDLLKMALLFHDIGKSKGHGHVEKGLLLLPDAFERLGLDGEDARTVLFLVREHLLMSRVSQRSDFTVDEVIGDFVGRVKTRERLRLLYLLTMADGKATARGAYSRWVDALLTDLLRRAEQRMSGSLSVERVDAFVARAVAAADDRGLPSDRVREHLDAMPPRYGLEAQPDEVAVHAVLASRIGEGAISAVHLEVTEGWTRLWVAARDRRRLLSDLCGALGVLRLGIIAADVYTRHDGIALNRFLFEAPQEDASIPDEARIEAVVRDVLSGDLDPAVEFGRRSFFEVEDEPFGRDQVAIRFDDRVARDRFAIELEAFDRPALLFDVTRCLADADLDILFARIVTKGANVDDTFHVRPSGADEEEIRLEPERRSSLRRELERAVLGADEVPTTDSTKA